MHDIAYIISHTYTSKLVVTDQPTDRQTDRQTDIVPYRAAIAAKNIDQAQAQQFENNSTGYQKSKQVC